MRKTDKTVNLGEIGLSKTHSVLSCYGLGSCVAVALFDPETKIGGLAHVVLPEDAEYNLNMGNKEAYLLLIDLLGRPAKFADSGLTVMLNKLKECGAKLHNLQAKVVGGARVLPPISLNSLELDIGKQNEIAVKRQLERYDIPIVASDLGGSESRMVKFHPADGAVEVWRNWSGKIVI